MSVLSRREASIFAGLADAVAMPVPPRPGERVRRGREVRAAASGHAERRLRQPGADSVDARAAPGLADACVVGSGAGLGVNPQITIMTLATRLAAHLCRS